jgi:drug/metabolite transporter (DMT)-like permease
MPSSSTARGIKPYLAFSGCVLIWGSTFLFIRIGNETVPPVWAAALRLGLASVILGTILRLRREPFPRGASLRTAIVFGVFQFGLNFPLLYLGERSVPSSMSSVLFGTIPLLSALLARAVGLERLTATKVVGAVVGFLGVGVIFSGQLQSNVPALDLTLVLLAVVVACIGAVILKRGPRPSAIATNAVGAATGCLMALAWSFLAREPHALPSTSAAWIPILYLTLAGSVGAFVLWSWLVGQWPVTRTSHIAVVAPIVAVILGAAVRREQLAPVSLAGSLLVWVGVVVGMRPDRVRAAH